MNNNSVPSLCYVILNKYIFLFQHASVMGVATSSSNSRGVSRESSSASSPEPRSPDDAGNSVSNSNSNASMSLGNILIAQIYKRIKYGN